MPAKNKNNQLVGVTFPPLISFSRLCKEIRKRGQATQQEMADLVGVTLRAWQDWEIGREPKGRAVMQLLFLKNYLNIKDQEVLIEQEREKEIA